MDVTKVKAAISNVKAEVSSLYKAVVAAGEKDPTQLSGLQSLGKANLLLDKVVGRIDQAVERTTPKVPKAKEGKSDAKTVADAAAKSKK